MNLVINRTRKALECLSHLAVILGVPLFFWQLSVQKETQRTQESVQRKFQRADNSMRFIELSNSEYIAEIRSVLAEPWENLNVSALIDQNPSEQSLERAKKAVVEQVRDRDIENLTDFYKAVLLCRNQEYCDKKLIDDFYRLEVDGFYCAYEGRLQLIAERLNRPDYAVDLKNYAGRCS